MTRGGRIATVGSLLLYSSISSERYLSLPSRSQIQDISRFNLDWFPCYSYAERKVVRLILYALYIFVFMLNPVCTLEL